MAGKLAAAPVEEAQSPTSGRKNRLATIRFLFHSIAFSYFLRVWLWHFTEAASFLPGASGFGWFFRYLTFCSFTLQTCQLLFCTLDDLSPMNGWRQFADDLSCALFGLANVVTILYYTIEAATKQVVEGGTAQRPPWLGVSVHLLNSVVAWTDLIISHPRSFTPRARLMSLFIVFAYSHWLLFLRFYTGSFPYPFMNKLPFPQGYLVVILSGLVLFMVLFAVGRWINNIINSCSIYMGEHFGRPTAATCAT